MINSDATISQFVWKSAAMRDMTLAVCRLAITRAEFSALDLPTHGEDRHGGSGIAGSVFGLLAKADIIEPVIVGWDGERPLQRQVRNKAGNPIGVWRIKSGPLARALIARHDPPVVAPVEQGELFSTARWNGGM